MAPKKKEERVEIVNKYGTIARPLKSALDLWLAKGWTLKDKPSETVNKEQN